MPHKNPADRTAHRQAYYHMHVEWEVSRVKDWKRNNREKATQYERERKRRVRAKKRKAEALVALATARAKIIMAERARGYTGTLRPGGI